MGRVILIPVDGFCSKESWDSNLSDFLCSLTSLSTCLNDTECPHKFNLDGSILPNLDLNWQNPKSNDCFSLQVLFYRGIMKLTNATLLAFVFSAALLI